VQGRLNLVHSAVEDVWKLDANAAHFVPSKSDPLKDQPNAAMRFAMYFPIIILIIKSDINLLFIVIAVGVNS
jgi:hypothetical protein